MNLKIDKGAMPWEPNKDVDEIDIWHFHDTPTCGAFVCQGRKYLFSVLDPETLYARNLITVWLYADITDMDLPLFSSLEEMNSVIDDILLKAEYTAVIKATPDLKIFYENHFNRNLM